MTAFASAAELATYLGVTFDAGQSTRALALITYASGLLQAEYGQDIVQTVNDSVTLYGNGGDTLVLPQGPVTAVSEVKEDGNLLTLTTDYLWFPNRLLRRMGFLTNTHDLTMSWALSSGMPWHGDPFWGIDHVVTVKYTHGFAAIPDAIKLATLMLAARLFERPDGGGELSSETIGTYAYTLSQVEQMGSPLDIDAIMAPFADPVVV